MSGAKKDKSLDTLLDLDGVTMFVDERETYWVKFRVKRIAPSTRKPHGVDYALTLHAPNGERLLGYDNAHAVRTGTGPGGKKTALYDHRHRYGRTRPYKFVDAGTLVEDFWKDVEKILKEKGAGK